MFLIINISCLLYFPQEKMTLRFGSIIIHKPDPNSEAEASNVSSDDAEVAEVAETATLKYNNGNVTNNQRNLRQKRIMKKSRSLESRRSSVSSTASKDLPILRILASDKSPPLMRSHYTHQVEDRLHGKDVPRLRHHRASSISSDEISNDGDRLGCRGPVSRPRTRDVALKSKWGSTVPDVTSSFTTPFVFDDDAAITGITKLLKNLNFTEKLRQQRAQQERLDIHKLPCHMKEQLKHIYVY